MYLDVLVHLLLIYSYVMFLCRVCVSFSLSFFLCILHIIFISSLYLPDLHICIIYINQNVHSLIGEPSSNKLCFPYVLFIRYVYRCIFWIVLYCIHFRNIMKYINLNLETFQGTRFRSEAAQPLCGCAWRPLLWHTLVPARELQDSRQSCRTPSSISSPFARALKSAHCWLPAWRRPVCISPSIM